MLRCPMKRVLCFLGTMVLGGFALLLIAALAAYSGAYDVSVTSGHTKLVEKTLNGFMVRSVRAHARDVMRPAGLDLPDHERLEKAAGHFEAMCRTCHGAPGRKPDPWLLYPPAPDLAEAQRDRPWSDAELFWIIKNGIKDTAMGAFGGTHPGAHSDEEIWGMVTLIRQFPTLPHSEYAAMSEAGRAKATEQGHGPETPPDAASPNHPRTDPKKSGESHKH